MTGRRSGQDSKEGDTKEADLEGRLHSKPTMGTDLMEFMVIAGWNYSLPVKESEDLRNHLKVSYTARRQHLPRKIKLIETHLMVALTAPYHGRGLKTIGMLKEFIEKEGLRFRGLGYRGLAYLNETLHAYGLEPIRVGGRPSPALLRRYGLKSSKGGG